MRLQTYGGARTPTGLQLTNVWRWFTLALQAKQASEGKATRPRTVHLLTVLYITFDKPSVTNNLSISSPDMKLPTLEVKDFNQRTAIIVFDGPLPAGTLVIRAHR